MYTLIYINYTEKVWGMHIRWNYPPCIRRRNKECLPFNTTLVLQGFIPGFSVTVTQSLNRHKNAVDHLFSDILQTFVTEETKENGDLFSKEENQTSSNKQTVI